VLTTTTTTTTISTTSTPSAGPEPVRRRGTRPRFTAVGRAVAVVAVLAVVSTSCGSGGGGSSADGGGSPSTPAASAADLAAVGLWDDGPCDQALGPLKVGMLTTFESPVITAKDQAQALEAATVAFNRRGGANGHCVQVVTCDERADQNQALECTRTLDQAGISVTVNDATASTPGPEVGQAFADAGIARFAISSATPDLSDLNSYPIDAGGIGTTLVMPQALVDQGVTKIATIRVDLPAASAIIGLFQDIYDGAEFVADIPVPAGTTDYSQFILAAENAGAEGVVIPLGGQEAIQVLRAADQLGSDLLFSTSLGTLPYADVADLGDLADQVILNGPIPPATADEPAIHVLVADLAASGEDALQPERLKSTAMKSWIGLYALLTIVRTAHTEDFSRANLTSLIEASGPIDMLGLTSDWTPKTDNPGTFPRTGNGHYSFWRWDPDQSFGDQAGNFVEAGSTDFNDLLCGSPLGAPADTC
jgi:branched-chain amino acid transport system substrate-binding protein